MSDKFAFIICVNDNFVFSECQYYLSQLEVPKGYEVEMIEVQDATSMCAGYNEAMHSTDAKYKIYIHQDVCIIKKDFLHQLLCRFQKDEKLGIIGMVGGTKLPASGVIFDSWDEGKVDVREPDMSYWLEFHPDNRQDTMVRAVDGLLIATQYDIQWREDLFCHFDFYDVSQCLEFKKAGYDILVPYQEQPWVIHDCSFCKLSKYDEERQKLVAEYQEFLTDDRENTLYYHKEWDEMSEQLGQLLVGMIEAGKWSQAESLMQIYHEKNHKSSALERMHILIKIHQLEEKRHVAHFFEEGMSAYSQIYAKYIKVRGLLRRIEMGYWDEECEELKASIQNKQISLEAVTTIVIHGCVYKKKMIEWLRQILPQEQILVEYEKMLANTESVKSVGGKRRL